MKSLPFNFLIGLAILQFKTELEKQVKPIIENPYNQPFEAYDQKEAKKMFTAKLLNVMQIKLSNDGAIISGFRKSVSIPQLEREFSKSFGPNPSIAKRDCIAPGMGRLRLLMGPLLLGSDESQK